MLTARTHRSRGLHIRAVREFLGPIASGVEVATISTTVRIKATARTLAVAMAAA